MRLVIAISCLALCGCVHTTDYPADWAETTAEISSLECPDISGRYKSLGRSADDDNTVTDLAKWIWIPQQPERDDPRITIWLEGRDIVVALFDPPENEINRIRLAQDYDDFSCSDGQLWISQNSWADPQVGSGGLVIAREKTQIGFSKTKDGSLLGELYQSGSGVFMLIGLIPIPGATKANDFILWSAID